MHVEAADEPEVDRGAAGRRVVGDPEPVLVLLDARGPDVRGGIGAVGQDPGAGLLADADEGARARIVGIDDPGRGPRSGPGLSDVRREPLEEAQLRVAVGLPGAVQFKVLVGQVGQDRDVVGDRIHASERQPVRGRLDDGGGVPGQDHGANGTLEVRRLGGGGVLRVVDLDTADARRDRAGHPGPDAGRLERRDREERGRRLAVRAGDADDAKLATGIAVPPGGRSGQRGPWLTDDELRERDLGKGVVDQRRSGTTGRGIADEVVAVGVEPGHGHEQRPGMDIARIVGHATDRDRGEPGRADRAPVPACAAKAAFGREAVRQAAEGGRIGGLGRRHEVVERPIAHRRASRATRAARRPAR